MNTLALTAIVLLARPALEPVVEVEEEVYSFKPADNGAGPMWCHGSTCLARVGDDVFASGLETLEGVPPLNNCRWLLLHRGPDGWRQLHVDPSGRTREPCPLAVFHDGRLFLSANPTLATDPNVRAGPARPAILRFSARDPKTGPETLLPAWDGSPAFTEHSYRSLAADGARGELVLLQNIGYTHAEWALLDAQGRWSARGRLAWPWGAEYDKPQPVRVCYPNVALAGRAVYFCGVSDIVEPYEKWRKYKEELTGREWDYDFRRLFFTWSKDIATGKFEPWVEIASRDKTAGWITPGDLHVGPDGAVHLVWIERAIDERLRERFFPGEKQSHAMNYAVVREGQVVLRRTLLAAEEGGPREVPGAARFHPAPDGRLMVFFYVSGTDAAGKAILENRILEVLPGGEFGPAARVPMEHPMTSFFTATPRAGSRPSAVLDLLGTRAGGRSAISYARIRLR